MGRKVLVLGLMLNILFGSMVHVVASSDHTPQLLTLLEASDVHKDGFEFTSTTTGAKTTLKIPLFRCIASLQEISPFVFTRSCHELTPLVDHSEIGKQSLLSMLYPAHTFP